MRSVEQINERIRKGEVCVVRADEMPELWEESPERAFRQVDVVTTASFGAMCSSGVFLNFGHADPPIKMQRVWLNNVEAYTGIAAVDAYLGATQPSEDRGIEYGGGHVIEELVKGEEVELRAIGYGTDCYPRRRVEVSITLDAINEAVMLNPRNCYQRYRAAVNLSDRTLYTYMGTLLPEGRNVNFAGVGELSPLLNDPSYETIGVGTRILVGGAEGYVIGEGTQHNPSLGLGTLMIRADLKGMDPTFVRGATIPNYGPTLFLGIAVPIPIISPEVAKSTAITNEQIEVEIIDYGVARRERPIVAKTTYAELYSGRAEVKGKVARTSPLSSLRLAMKLADLLRELIEGKEFFLTQPVRRLRSADYPPLKPMRLREEVILVRDVMVRDVVTAKLGTTIEEASRILVEKEIDHLPIVDSEGRLAGIVTSWDITKAVAEKKRRLEEIMTKDVIVSREDEPIDAVTRRLEKYNIAATPVVDEDNRVIGIIGASDIVRKVRRRYD